MSPSKVPIFPVRLDSALKAAALAAARKRHLSVSDWIRQAIIEQAIREGIEVQEKPDIKAARKASRRPNEP